jgi:hypothetical protein
MNYEEEEDDPSDPSIQAFFGYLEKSASISIYITPPLSFFKTLVSGASASM